MPLHAAPQRHPGWDAPPRQFRLAPQSDPFRAIGPPLQPNQSPAADPVGTREYDNVRRVVPYQAKVQVRGVAASRPLRPWPNPPRGCLRTAPTASRPHASPPRHRPLTTRRRRHAPRPIHRSNQSRGDWPYPRPAGRPLARTGNWSRWPISAPDSFGARTAGQRWQTPAECRWLIPRPPSPIHP